MNLYFIKKKLLIFWSTVLGLYSLFLSWSKPKGNSN